ncbi:MAG: PIN domain-containing protein, partial [Humidesulfovibrio sp.]|nr:PIN domain-containing protein [Humidesulfovibrio sp.]
MPRVFFCDTNLFLQCRSVESLPWHEIADGHDEIVVYVPRTVQNEIDRLKQDGNSRRATRARKASTLTKKIALSSDSRVSFRSAAVTVSVMPAEPRPLSFQPPEALDMDLSDDRIVAEAMAWAHVNSAPVSILTNDGGMMNTAKHFSVHFTGIPDEWLLPPEQDERDKKVAELERELIALKKMHPIVESCFYLDTKLLKKLDIVVITYNELKADHVEAFVKQIQMYHPMTTSFEKPPARKATDLIVFRREWRPPPASELRKYIEEEYPTWVEKLRERLSHIGRSLEAKTRQCLVSMDIKNSGSRPAQTMRMQ